MIDQERGDTFLCLLMTSSVTIWHVKHPTSPGTRLEKQDTPKGALENSTTPQHDPESRRGSGMARVS